MSKYYKSNIRIKKYEETINEDGEEVFVETPEWREFKEKQFLKRKFINSSIPSHVINLELDDYIGEDREKIEKLKTYVEKFKEKFSSIHLYFWSHENSTQKTTTASIVGKNLLKKGYSVQFILMSHLLKALSEEKFNEEHSDILDKIRKSDFLIIDDSFDKKKATIYKSGYQIPFLDEFLRNRLEIQKKAICFSSNFSISEIDEEIFGKSIKSLVRRSVLDPFLFKSSYELRNDFNPKDLWS
jgi:DNA replication protein DnaC